MPPYIDTFYTPKCPKHPDARALCNEKHNAFYCPKCDAWLEPKCKVPTCEWCAPRPDKPSEAT